MTGEQSSQTSEKNKQSLVAFIAAKLIQIDLKFLLIRSKGREHAVDLETNKRYEPWFSYVEALLHNELHENQPDLQTMLGEVRTYIIAKVQSREFNTDVPLDLQVMSDSILKTQKWPEFATVFAALAQQWEVKHPGRRFL